MLALFGLDLGMMEGALRQPERVEIRPESFNTDKRYPILGFHRGDVTVILGLRQPMTPKVIAGYAHSRLQHDTHPVGHTGGGGSKGGTKGQAGPGPAAARTDDQVRVQQDDGATVSCSPAAPQNTYFAALSHLLPPKALERPLTALVGGPDGLSERVLADFLVGLSPPTAAAYGRDLRCAFGFLYGIGVPPLQAERRHLERYVRSCHDRGLAPRTTARRLVALSGFLTYAVEQGLLPSSPMTAVRRPRQAAQPARRALDLDEARWLLQGAAEHSPRAHALVSLLLGTGLRISAVCSLDVADLCRGTTTTVRYRNKGGGWASTVLTTDVVTTVDGYLAGRSDGPLLLSQPTGRRLDRGGAHRLLKRIAATALPGRSDVSAHTLRSTFCQLALQAGVGLQDVSLALAHVSVAHTQPYLAAALQHEHHPAHAVAAALQPRHRQSLDQPGDGDGHC